MSGTDRTTRSPADPETGVDRGDERGIPHRGVSSEAARLSALARRLREAGPEAGAALTGAVIPESPASAAAQGTTPTPPPTAPAPRAAAPVAEPSSAPSTTDAPSSEPLVEARPMPRADAGSIFVSPRVVDHRAFVEYAAELRELIARADDHRGALSGAETQVTAIRDRIREATGELRGRLEAITKLVPALDRKMEQCDSSLRQATEAAGLIEATEQRISAMIAERLADAEKDIAVRIEAMERSTDTRIARLEAGLAKAEARAEAAETRAEALREQLEAHAASHKSGIAEHADTIVKAIDERAVSARSSLEGALREASAQRESLLTGVVEAASAAGDSLDNLEARAARVLSKTDRAEKSVLPALEESCAKAERMLGLGTGDDAGGLPGAITRADGAAAALRTLIDELGEAKSVADESRTHLGHALIAAGEKIKKLSEREQELSSQIAKTADLASSSEAELTKRAEQLRELLDAPVRQIGAQVEQAGQWLSEVIRHADDRGRALSALVERLEAGQRPGAATDAGTPPGTDAASAGDATPEVGKAVRMKPVS